MLRAASSPFPIPPSYTGQTQPYILSRSAIPFVGLSSGSVSAVGAITGITALPLAYASAYCWFPANILATVKAAGWYYCTFSTTTAGTAFLNTYTSGDPTIPTSPTAVTDGKGAFTGDTGEEFGPTITVPANALGPNGLARIWTQWAYTNSAGTKTCRARYSGNAGTTYISAVPTTSLTMAVAAMISNRGATNAQVGAAGGSTATAVPPFGSVSASALNTSAVDTTAATTAVLSHQRNTATDNAVLESYLIELLYGA